VGRFLFAVAILNPPERVAVARQSRRTYVVTPARDAREEGRPRERAHP